jgi:hypothetical protein
MSTGIGELDRADLAQGAHHRRRGCAAAAPSNRPTSGAASPPARARAARA